MRCNNCGWNNAEDARHCVKCNSVLGVGAPGSGGSGSLEPGRGVSTLQGAAARGSWPRELVVCPKCKYPASRQVERCPMCGSLMKGDGDAGVVSGGVGDAGGDVTGSGGVAAAEMTMDPFRQGKEEGQEGALGQQESTGPQGPRMWLERVGKPNEASAMLSFVAADDEVAVGRQSVDEANYTITSRVQASFVWKDNKWWMVDKSEMKTTYIQVREPVEMKDGDVVLMGDRRFVFYGSEPGAQNPGPGGENKT